jgi:hypothetical protein
MRDRIRRFLEERDTGASSEEIAAYVLKLRGAAGAVADRVVEAAVEGDAQFVRDGAGAWTLRPVNATTPLREVLFVVAGARPAVPVGRGAERLGSICGIRVGVGHAEERLPETRVGPDATAARGALASFESFSQGAVPAAFRLPRVRRLVNRSSHEVLGRPVLEGGICLYRMGRRWHPERSLPSLEALGEAAGLPHLAEGGLEQDVDLQVQVLLASVERYLAQGITTVEGVMADLHPDATPVDFEAFAFDEAFLDELPTGPGVYVMREKDGGVIYVGKSINIRDRVRTYFARRSERPEKTRRILERIWSVEVERVGSELEALILESRLIRRCQPEFNTQVAVHDRSARDAVEQNFVLVLPSSESGCAELYCVRRDRAVEQARVRRDLSDWGTVSEQITSRYFGDTGPDPGLEEGDAADSEILRGWVAQNREDVNLVDMDAFGSAQEAARVLGDYVRGCDLDGWEKVWRI